MRESNIAVIEDYKNRIKLTGERQKELEEKVEYYRKANALLGQEHKQLREKYDETLSSVNETLLKKSTVQIKLNQLREETVETKGKTLDFEHGIVELNEDMITDRRESALQQGEIQAKIDETKDKLKLQRSANFKQRKELDAVTQDQLVSNAGLERVRDRQREAVEANRLLQEEFDELTVVLGKKTHENQALTSQKMAIVAGMQTFSLFYFV